MLAAWGVGLEGLIRIGARSILAAETVTTAAIGTGLNGTSRFM
jgi:hypothetical protein